jgi:hypothetical protein
VLHPATRYPKQLKDFVMSADQEQPAASAPNPTDEQPTTSTLPSRTLSKEDLELAEHLIQHSQGIQNMVDRNGADAGRISPNGEAQAVGKVEGERQQGSRSVSPNGPQGQRMSSEERNQGQPIITAEPVPNGQVCRYVNFSMQ